MDLCSRLLFAHAGTLGKIEGAEGKSTLENDVNYQVGNSLSSLNKDLYYVAQHLFVQHLCYAAVVFNSPKHLCFSNHDKESFGLLSNKKRVTLPRNAMEPMSHTTPCILKDAL